MQGRKMTEEKRKRIKKYFLFNPGISQTEIAKIFGVSEYTINIIVKEVKNTVVNTMDNEVK